MSETNREPYYQDDWVTIYHGECEDVLPTIANGDAFITDPPFSDSTHNNAQSNRGGEGARKAIDFQAIDFQAIDFQAIDFVLRQAERICRGWFIAFMDWRHIMQLEFAPDTFWELVRFGVWVKTNPMPQLSADRPANGWDGIAYCYPRGQKKSWHGGGAHGNWIGPVITNGDHPTGKPLDLLSVMVERFTDPGQMIIDPFMGSGTTLRAAKNLGRKAIGIERQEKYCEVAARRMLQESMIL